MNRATVAATASAAVAVTAVLLGSVLTGAWGDAGASDLSRIASTDRESLPLRLIDVPVTLTARPRPVAASRDSADPSGRSRVRAGRSVLPSAAQRDADLAGWLAGALPGTGPTPQIGTDQPQVAQPQVAQAPADPPPAGAVSASFTVGSFNVLGSSHTRGGARGMATGVARVPGVVQLLEQHALDVVGFQELQADQLRELQRRAPGWELFPGRSLSARDAENSLGWRSDVWQLVRSSTVQVPYFDGHPRRMPVVVLRHRATGIAATFVNVHNPADTRRHRGQQRWRDQATNVEVSLLDDLVAGGTPVFLTGDMNERAEYFCAITGRTSMVAARGGSNGPGGCAAGSPRAVDWVFGSAGVRFTGYTEDRGPLVDRTTDHPVVVARATVDTTTFPASR